MNALILLLSVVADLASGRGKNELAEGLGLLSDLVKAGKDGSDEFDELAAELQAMVDVGRDPTPQETAAIRTRRQTLSAQLQGLAQDETETAPGQDETGPGAPGADNGGPAVIESGGAQT